MSIAPKNCAGHNIQETYLRKSAGVARIAYNFTTGHGRNAEQI